MADDRPASEVASITRCPWCSAPLESPGAATCPSCGATLSADSEPQLPGVTTVAPSSISRAAQRRPNRIVQWITGESGEPPAPPLATPAPGSLTPPGADVRVEMLRLEIAARLADRTAEIEALETEARLEAGHDNAPPNADAEPGAPSEPKDEPKNATARASTWAELDEGHGAEPPTTAPAATASPPTAPHSATSPEGKPGDAAATSPDSGLGASPESPEPHA